MSVTLARRFNEINDIEQFLNAFVENKNDYYEDIRKETPIFAGEFLYFQKIEYKCIYEITYFIYESFNISSIFPAHRSMSIAEI